MHIKPTISSSLKTAAAVLRALFSPLGFWRGKADAELARLRRELGFVTEAVRNTERSDV